MLIGEKIKVLRKVKRMKLKELAEKSGVQIATLSRIEHKKMMGTVESHIKIAKALGIDITELYKDIKSDKSEIETPIASSLAESFSYNDKASYEILASNILSKRMLPIVLKIEPGGRTSLEQNLPDTEKFIFILEGDVTVHIDKSAYALSTNGTLYFKASFPHFIENNGNTTTKLISVITPVSL